MPLMEVIAPFRCCYMSSIWSPRGLKTQLGAHWRGIICRVRSQMCCIYTLVNGIVLFKVERRVDPAEETPHLFCTMTVALSSGPRWQWPCCQTDTCPDKLVEGCSSSHIEKKSQLLRLAAGYRLREVVDNSMVIIWVSAFTLSVIILLGVACLQAPAFCGETMSKLISVFCKWTLLLW